MKLSKKLLSKINAPTSCGTLAARPGMRLATGTGARGSARLKLYLLVDEEDGLIADAKFQAYGPPLLVGSADATCELILRKSYEQARHIPADLIDRASRDRPEEPAFPKEAAPWQNLVLEALDEATAECMDIPLSEKDFVTPFEADETGTGYPGFRDLPHTEKINVIEKIMETDIRPYIALDSGGVKLIELTPNLELIIGYEGSCTTCHSSTGSTLSAIQALLRAKVDRSLVVVPDVSLLQH